MSSWRDVITVHPAADLFPLLVDAELRDLADDICRNGLREKIKIIERPRRGDDGAFHVDFEQVVIDGRNRLDALALAGETIFRCGKAGTKLEPDIIEVRDDLKTDDEIAAYVISVNIKRRHLTGEQNRDLTAKLLKLDPNKSNRQIAAVVGVDHKTVGAVRKEAQATGEIPQLKKTTGKDGKARKASKAPKSKAAVEAPEPATVNALSEPLMAEKPEPEEGGKADEAPPLSPDGKHDDDYQTWLAELDAHELVKLLQRLDEMLRQHRDWAWVIKAFGPVKFSEMVNTMRVELDQYSQAKADRAEAKAKMRAATRADKAKVLEGAAG